MPADPRVLREGGAGRGAAPQQVCQALELGGFAPAGRAQRVEEDLVEGVCRALTIYINLERIQLVSCIRTKYVLLGM